MTLACPYCPKVVKSERGLTQHILATPRCSKMHRWEISNRGNGREEAEQVARMMEAATEVDSSMEDSEECVVDFMNFGAEMDAEPALPLQNDDDSSDKDDDDLELLRALLHHQYEDFGGNDSLNSDVSILKDKRKRRNRMSG